MESSKTPINMEENKKLSAGYTSDGKKIEINKKDATKDFINAEASILSANTESAGHHSILIEPNVKNVSNDESEKEHDKQNSIGTSHNTSVTVSDIFEQESVAVGLDSDTENNDNDNSPVEDASVQKKSIANFDDDLPSTVTLLTTPGGSKCYLVGTAHFSIESQNDVSKVIRAVQPHIVMVELCRDRIHVLQLDEETILRESKSLNMSKIVSIIKQHGVYRGIFYLLLLNLSAYLTKVLGLAPGGEFRTAFREAKKIPNCIVQMGDRPIQITFARAFNSLGWWQKIKLTWHILKERGPIDQKDIEKFKKKDALEQVMAELVGEYPEIGEVFVKERDIFLTHSLQLACRPRIGINGKPVPVRVVGVVGIGHTLGIVENWGKVKRSQIPPILSIPPTSLKTKILKITIKASFIGAIVYIGYKCIPISASAIQSIKSSVAGLMKVGASMVSMAAKYGSDEYEHTLPDVMYVISNIPGPGCQLDDFELQFSIGCSCDQKCKDNCSCIRGSQNYDSDQLLIENSNSIIECNLNCTCDEKCGNRLVQNGPLNCLIVKKINNNIGFGLFTTKLIKKGQFICEYAGEVIGIDEAQRRFEENRVKKSMNYVLVVSEHVGNKKITTCIDPAKFGNIGRYSNHSCEPNAMLVPIRVDITIPRLCLFALRDIEPMEEITFNYAGCVANSVQNLSKTPCLCGSNLCLGYLPHCPV